MSKFPRYHIVCSPAPRAHSCSARENSWRGLSWPTGILVWLFYSVENASNEQDLVKIHKFPHSSGRVFYRRRWTCEPILHIWRLYRWLRFPLSNIQILAPSLRRNSQYTRLYARLAPLLWDSVRSCSDMALRSFLFRHTRQQVLGFSGNSITWWSAWPQRYWRTDQPSKQAAPLSAALRGNETFSDHVAKRILVNQ